MSSTSILPLTAMDVEQKFRNLMEAMVDKSDFWEHAFELVRENADVVFDKENLNKLRRILTDYLLNHASGDFTTVKRVMDTCALGIGWRSICRRHRTTIFSGILNPSKGFNRTHKKCMFSGFRLLDLAIARADVQLMKLLVKYGLFQISPENSLIFHDISEAEIALRAFCGATNHFGLNLEVSIVMCSHMAKKLVNQLRESSYNFRRFQLILRVLDAIARRRINYDETDDCVKCVKLFFETITDPFVTETEVNFFLMYLFRYESSHDAADILSEDYATLFPTEALGPLQPRRLMHLCRCSIRQAIVKNCKFLPPQVVNELYIPRRLQSYILIECDV